MVVGTFDVFRPIEDAALAEVDLSGTSGEIREITVRFHPRNWYPEPYEFRNYWQGTGQLSVYEITLQELAKGK